MSHATHRRLLCAAALAVLIPCGLVCRFVPIGLPYFIVKYGGSFLWATMVYLLIALLLPERRPPGTGTLAAALAAAIECAKLIPSSALDALRSTFTGKVLLGRHFSFKDIAVYWLAIACAMWIEERATRRRPAAKG